LESIQLAEKIAEIILSKKGSEVKFLDLKKLTTMADYFVVCSADSDVQVKAIADEVRNKLAEEGIKVFHREGYDTLNWIILDYFDVVVHIFKAAAREYYKLEKLWGDAPVTEITDEVE